MAESFIKAFQGPLEGPSFVNNLLLAYNALNNVNRACFPAVNLIRSLIVGGAQALGMNTTGFPEFKNNKIISFNVPKSILVVEDVIRFGECWISAGTLGLTSIFMMMKETSSLDTIRALGVLGMNTAGACGEAFSFAADILAHSQKEVTELLRKSKKSPVMLYAEDNTEIELLSLNKSIGTALDILRDLGHADLCWREVTATSYQLVAAHLLTPEVMKAPVIFSQILLSLPYSANQDCLPYVNFLRYAFIEAENLILGYNKTYTPTEGSIWKLSDFGISEDSITGKTLGGVGMSVDAIKCVTASTATLLVASGGYQYSKDWNDVLSTVEVAMLEMLAGGTSCSKVYTSLRQKYYSTLAL
eukprot:CAMPEP_0176424598 /NCGR_PEP_ID=MMETSP0127-20121128/10919_1 /TAXON_ID=938130 /ORGANISM="Platyophrya macrostoma, Strain WH" /LENGTH=358 /DNA_ID=CAMNT_0017805659 /DNA_START=252 /DNA_END=1328 /DNA_ORIENTATION=-